jgi:hypothetical protein
MARPKPTRKAARERGASLPGLFAVVGDVHGEMHTMVRLLQEWERTNQERLSFVLQVGDFQPIRDAADLASTPVPAKYRRMGDFADFYEERSEFPWPVRFIGGNHEPFGLLNSMPKGGDVAYHCHYLGRAGAINHAGLRIGYLSGISPPESPRRQRRAAKCPGPYYTEHDLSRATAAGRVDLLLLHQWPEGAIDRPEASGRRRAAGASDPGSETARILVELLQPQVVFAGHMHWPHRSRLSERTTFYGLAHIDQGRDAFAVFRAAEGGIVVEID